MYNAVVNFLNSSDVASLATETIGGVQSGTLTKKRYTVNADIVVLGGTTLTLTAGSIFEMEENVLWDIDGVLNATGTASEKIEFKTASGADHWHGIRFLEEYASATGTLTVNTSTNVVTTGWTINEDWPVRFTTTGTLPAPLQPNQRYYFRSDDTLALRMGGSEIDITDSGSGTHTAHRLNPELSDDLQPTDWDETQTLKYCVFSDADKSGLPSNYSNAYRHWERGGAVVAYEIEDMDFANLEFYRCETFDRGGGMYIQGLTSTSVAISLSDFYFEDCVADNDTGACFASSHGQASVTITNFEFSNSSCPLTEGYPFTADSSTDRITIANPLNYAIGDNLVVKNLASTGTLPGGLAADTIYYILEISNTQFQLSTTPGGSAIDITSNGTGTLTFDLATDFYYFDTTFNVSGLTFS